MFDCIIKFMELSIIYEDNFIIVVDKPAGIATQSARVGETDLESELKKYRKAKGEAPEIYVVHRLDQPVSGLIVFAKTKAAAAGLTKDMQREAFSKIYLAAVFKTESFKPEAALTDFIVKDAKTNRSYIAASPKDRGTAEARLSYVTVREEGKTAVLKITLETGRHHQIRLQLSNAGMPLLGDLKYGSKESIEYSRGHGIKNVALCAYTLRFVHPITQKALEFESQTGPAILIQCTTSLRSPLAPDGSSTLHGSHVTA